MTEPAPEAPSETAAVAGFDELFTAGFAQVVRSVVFWGASQAAAEEFAQEAFVTAFEKWDDIYCFDRPIAWVARTAVNKWLQYCRTTNRRSDLISKVAPRQTLEAVDDLAVAERRLDIQRLLRCLPDRQREVIVLHYIVDQPVSSIALTLGVSVGTVKSQLHDARSTLGRLIADDDGSSARKEA
jgi:RNA polymerase sigma-70 factor, ECF subfamily